MKCLDIHFPPPHHWIKFSHKMTGGKYVNCYVDCHRLVVLNFFIKYFFIFCVSVHTAKEPEVTNEGFGMLEGN